MTTKTFKKYEVQQHTLCEGWVNTWRILNEDGTETPETFNTRHKARTELDAFFKEIQEDIDNGDRAPDAGYSRDEFRIVEL